MHGLISPRSLTFFAVIITVCAIETRVFGGKDLRFDVHKYLVKLKIYHADTVPGRCSGSIIHHSWIVTSAHCLREDAKVVRVYHYGYDSVKVIAKAIKESFFIHPEYVFDGDRKGDIALIRTISPMKFNVYTLPVKLTSYLPRVGQKAIIAGYGESESEFGMPREGKVIIAPCPDHLDSGVICTSNTASAGPGDSGGALVSRGRLIGVTSGSCKDYTNEPCLTVYVSVEHHLKWIHEILSLFDE